MSFISSFPKFTYYGFQVGPFGILGKLWNRHLAKILVQLGGKFQGADNLGTFGCILNNKNNINILMKIYPLCIPLKRISVSLHAAFSNRHQLHGAIFVQNFCFSVTSSSTFLFGLLFQSCFANIDKLLACVKVINICGAIFGVNNVIVSKKIKILNWCWNTSGFFNKTPKFTVGACCVVFCVKVLPSRK